MPFEHEVITKIRCTDCDVVIAEVRGNVAPSTDIDLIEYRHRFACKGRP